MTMIKDQNEAEKKRLEFLDSLEAKFYRCSDYMQDERPSLEECTSEFLFSILQECASLVTDQATIRQSRRDSCTAKLISTPVHQVEKTPELNQNYPHSTSSPKSTIIQSSNNDITTTCLGNSQSLPDHHSSMTSFDTWRTNLCQWAYNIADYYGLEHEIIASAVHVSDRYIEKKLSASSTGQVTRNEYQLAFVTCIYLSVKALSHLCLGIGVFMDFGYTREQIEQTEYDIFQTLDWHVTGPTAAEYCHSCLSLSDMIPINVYDEFESIRTHLLKISTINSLFVSCPRSLLAVASTLIAIRMCSSSCQRLESSWINLCITKIHDIAPLHDKNAIYHAVYSHLEESLQAAIQ
jgi:Cyclin, N-terminal domain